jgi:hypothetical protein
MLEDGNGDDRALHASLPKTAGERARLGAIASGVVIRPEGPVRSVLNGYVVPAEGLVPKANPAGLCSCLLQARSGCATYGCGVTPHSLFHRCGPSLGALAAALPHAVPCTATRARLGPFNAFVWPRARLSALHARAAVQTRSSRTRRSGRVGGRAHLPAVPCAASSARLLLHELMAHDAARLLARRCGAWRRQQCCRPSGCSAHSCMWHVALVVCPALAVIRTFRLRWHSSRVACPPLACLPVATGTALVARCAPAAACAGP